MKLLPLNLLLAVLLAACNDKQTVAGSAVETEPNDTFATSDFLGAVGNATSADVTGNVEHDDGDNDDLEDHFSILPSFTGQITVTLTPVAPTANVSFTEELTSTTDGVVTDAAGAGQPESAQFNVTSGITFRLRVETAAAATDYTLNFLTPPAPLSAGDGQRLELHTWVADPQTGQLEHRVQPLTVGR
jgi:hypothetical protein